MPPSRTQDYLRQRQASTKLMAWLRQNAPSDESLWRDPDRFRPMVRDVSVGDRLLLIEAALELVWGSPSPRRLKGVLRTGRNIGFTRHRIDRLMVDRYGIDLYTLEACSILGVRPDAPEPTIKRAYRRLASRVHPDRVAHLGEAQQAAARRRMVVLNAALDRMLQPDIELFPEGEEPDDVELEPIQQVEVDDVLLEYANLDDDVEL